MGHTTGERVKEAVVAVAAVLIAAIAVGLVLDTASRLLSGSLVEWLRNRLVWLGATALVSVVLVPKAIGWWRELHSEVKERPVKQLRFQDPVGVEVNAGQVELSRPRNQSLADLSRELSQIGTQEDPDVVALVDRTLSEAIALHASDVHFEPGPVNLGIRLRLDGTLMDAARLPLSVHNTVINRLKVMSNLRPYERAVPQDGRIFAEIVGRAFDIRSSFLPTIHGEKAALRIFETRGEQFDLQELGLGTKLLQLYSELLLRPQGIVFVTGPTGSGKTTTMYASLRHIKANSANMVNILTLEDPVEYAIRDFSQTQVNEDAGLTFAKGLRTILRQDPDVIMLGEIRDQETAQVALQAGLTGHMMLTTVHADSTGGVFSRLMNMGCEPFLLSSASIGVLSQRLVRLLCPNCRRQGAPTDTQQRLLQQGDVDLGTDAMFYTAKGCDACFGAGYRGRTLIAELMPVTEAVREGITAKVPAGDLARIARTEGMRTLLETGIAKALNGITSIAEVLRVTR